MNKGSLLEPLFTQPLSTVLQFLVFVEAKNHWFAMC